MDEWVGAGAGWIDEWLMDGLAVQQEDGEGSDPREKWRSVQPADKGLKRT